MQTKIKTSMTNINIWKKLATGLALCAAIGCSASGLKSSWTSCAAGGQCVGGVGQFGGSKFSLVATVGQPNAGVAVGGTVVAQGGFLPAFQKTVLPPVTVTRAQDEFILSWPDVGDGLHLDWTQDLHSDRWFDLGEGTVVGSQRQARIPAFDGNLFFRLRKDCPK